jgi:hypothetical protein
MRISAPGSFAIVSSIAYLITSQLENQETIRFGVFWSFGSWSSGVKGFGKETPIKSHILEKSFFEEKLWTQIWLAFR